jgi:hypothetical protein
LGEKVFHVGDVPQHVSAMKKAVVNSKQANILKTRQDDWEGSTMVKKKVRKVNYDVRGTGFLET